MIVDRLEGRFQRYKGGRLLQAIANFGPLQKPYRLIEGAIQILYRKLMKQYKLLILKLLRKSERYGSKSLDEICQAVGSL